MPRQSRVTQAADWTATRTLEVEVAERPWCLDGRFAATVDGYWSKITLSRPHFFRGPVLAVEQATALVDGRTRVLARLTDFAHFLFSRHHLSPGHPYYVRIITACAWVITKDRLAVVGLGHPESAKPLVWQPIGGSPSCDDIHSGYFDPVIAARRELQEETGLTLVPGEVRGYLKLDNGSLAVAVRFDLPRLWSEVEAELEAHVSQSKERELSAIYGIPTGAPMTSFLGFPVLRSVQAFLVAAELR